VSPLAQAQLANLLEPYFPAPDSLLLERLSTYLALLVKWNARTNLSAIREPEEIVRRHFGESLFTALHLPREGTLLDVGSGAGFPGLPIALACPGLAVTLTESQNKKAAFLREAVRALSVRVEVWSGRAETLPADRLFDMVTLRAVDRPEVALAHARARVRPGGLLARLTTAAEGANGTFRLPNSAQGVLVLEPSVFHVEHGS